MSCLLRGTGAGWAGAAAGFAAVAAAAGAVVGAAAGAVVGAAAGAVVGFAAAGAAVGAAGAAAGAHAAASIAVPPRLATRRNALRLTSELRVSRICIIDTPSYATLE